MPYLPASTILLSNCVSIFFYPVDESFVSVASDTSYSEPPEVFDDETPSAKFVMVNTVETTRTQDTTPNNDEEVSR